MSGTEEKAATSGSNVTRVPRVGPGGVVARGTSARYVNGDRRRVTFRACWPWAVAAATRPGRMAIIELTWGSCWFGSNGLRRVTRDRFCLWPSA